jgi:hypothetical protein
MKDEWGKEEREREREKKKLTEPVSSLAVRKRGGRREENLHYITLYLSYSPLFWLRVNREVPRE